MIQMNHISRKIKNMSSKIYYFSFLLLYAINGYEQDL